MRCLGKGRKQRCVPLTPATTAILRVWLKERRGLRDEPTFPTRTGRRLSDDAVEARLVIHKSVARQRCPSLAAKKLTPHTLRHTCAMNLLHAGIDTSSIALWLGHASTQSTQTYLHADLKLKEEALALAAPPEIRTKHRYRPPDQLLAFLESL